jgi:hypothetical protein
MANLYDVQTDRYGVIGILRDDIASARKWAKQALGLPPSAVSAHREYKLCSCCDSAPCVCKNYLGYRK